MATSEKTINNFGIFTKNAPNSFFETEEKILKNLSEERSRNYEMRAKLADYAFENFQNRSLDELIRLDTRKFRNYLNFLSHYNKLLKKGDPLRVKRMHKANEKKTKFLKDYAFNKFKIPFTEFYQFVQDYEDDMILSQMDLNSVPKLYEASTIKDLNDEDENQLSQIDLSPFKDRLSKEVSSQNNCVQNDTNRNNYIKYKAGIDVSWIENDSLGPINLIKEKNDKYTFCNSCANSFNRKGQINVFGDLGQLPHEIKLLRSYYEYKDLWLFSLYCNVYQPTNYGTIGIIYQKESELPANKQNVKKALLWLEQNKVFYQNFLSAFERLDRYSLANNVFNGFPETNSGIKLNEDNRIEMSLNNPDENGLIIKVDER
ncbi:hypothetical protein BpHYR1_043574 [Brachionus plicatilis]|uniref:Uncharacterized protein n=1 Tax=Brachionus plicatilis TaxID=10195 RepID=A0A3M7SNA6_BRAPC|nr:hypothetical protein BpHYR1_043574 [Brachionus plicatilis]